MAKDYAISFYNSKRWKDTQATYMESQHYICERCKGMARVVHHKNYITPENINDPQITLAWDNLEALCMDCHNQEHIGNGRACQPGLAFDDSGQLIKH